MGGLHRTPETSFWVLVAAVSAFKLLLIKSYRSTDFEVHRNWLAITHSLPLKRWYYDETSEWTLDYPPFFAYFEWVLSNFAVYFDKEMLNVNHLNYDSPKTVLFQKFTVILGDFVLAYSVKKIVDVVGKNEVGTRCFDVYVKYCILIFANGGLFILDHIHFQYNGFMYGILLLSITKILEERYFQGAIIFAILLNLKHIYLYIAPAFGIYLFRKYCIEGSGMRLRLNFKNLCGLAVTVVSIFLISFGPFYRHLPQILSRLFPFKRGLCHAYWAPNIWALYNTVDIAINFVLKKGKSALTSGLIGEASLNVLPQIQPIHTFGLTLFFMMPTLLKILWKPSPANFLNGIILTAWTSFMFGYHVHEKAILNVIIPFAVISAAEPKLFFMTLVPGTFSLFPLLFTPFEIVLKLLICLLHIVLCFISLSPLNFNIFEKLYLVGFVPLYLIENIGPFILTRYSFLPLMLVSNYCFIGIFICYVGFYWRSLTSEYDEKLGLENKITGKKLIPKSTKRKNN